MNSQIESLRCKACGKELEHRFEYNFSDDLCEECSSIVEDELYED